MILHLMHEINQYTHSNAVHQSRGLVYEVYAVEFVQACLCVFSLSSVFACCLHTVNCLFVCVLRDGWPKDKRAEITISFFVSDVNSRKLHHKVNDKLWLVENYIRTQGTGRNSGPSHIGNFQYINSARFISVTEPLYVHSHIITSSPPPGGR